VKEVGSTEIRGMGELENGREGELEIRGFGERATWVEAQKSVDAIYCVCRSAIGEQTTKFSETSINQVKPQ